jgi:hypothetical protein
MFIFIDSVRHGEGNLLVARNPIRRRKDEVEGLCAVVPYRALDAYLDTEQLGRSFHVAGAYRRRARSKRESRDVAALLPYQGREP